MPWSAVVAALLSPGLVWAVINGWKHHQRLQLLRHVYDASGAGDARVLAEAIALVNGSASGHAEPTMVQAQSERLEHEELERGSSQVDRSETAT